MESHPWKSAPWNHIHGYFLPACWDKLKSEPISNPVDTFVKVLTEICDRYVSFTLPTVKCPTIWQNHFCQCTYKGKLEAWPRCNWPVYHIHVLAAKRAQATALHHCQRSLLNTGIN